MNCIYHVRVDDKDQILHKDATMPLTVTNSKNLTSNGVKFTLNNLYKLSKSFMVGSNMHSGNPNQDNLHF